MIKMIMRATRRGKVAALVMMLAGAASSHAQSPYAGSYLGRMNSRVEVPSQPVVESVSGAYTVVIGADGSVNVNSGGITGTIDSSGNVSLNGGSQLATFGITSARVTSGTFHSDYGDAVGGGTVRYRFNGSDIFREEGVPSGTAGEPGEYYGPFLEQATNGSFYVSGPHQSYRARLGWNGALEISMFDGASHFSLFTGTHNGDGSYSLSGTGTTMYGITTVMFVDGKLTSDPGAEVSPGKRYRFAQSNTFYEAGARPEITLQPVGGALALGEPFVFTTAASRPDATFRWYRNGTMIPSAGSSSLQISSAVAADFGTYHVVVGINGVTGAPFEVASEQVVLTQTDPGRPRYQVEFHPGSYATRLAGGESVQTVISGNSAIPPVLKLAPGFVLTGWSADFSVVTGNLTVTAVVEELPLSSHAVTFALGAHGTRVGGGELVQSVPEGRSARAPQVVATAGWAFAGWEGDFQNVAGEQTIHARYHEVQPEKLNHHSYIKSPSITGTYSFGQALALDGDFAISGAPGEKYLNHTNSGRAHIFRISDKKWSPVVALQAPHIEGGERFGEAVAISGNIAVVAAPFKIWRGTTPAFANAGAVYIYVRSGDTWNLEHTIWSNVRTANRRFGCSISLDGNTLVIGSHANVVEVYVRNGGVWGLQAQLTSAYTQSAGKFGRSVAISGDTVAVAGTESVTLFSRTGTVWAEAAHLTAAFPGADDGFGDSIALSGGTLLVGAPQEDSSAVGIGGNANNNSLSNSGAAYVYSSSGGTWALEVYIKASNPGVSDRFGSAVALRGNIAVVGAPQEDSNALGIGGNQADNSSANSGAAYVFSRSGASWTQTHYLKSVNSTPEIVGFGDEFGTAVAVSGYSIWVGAPAEDSNAVGVNGNPANNQGLDYGAAYAFSAVERYTVTFSLGVNGVRTGGGELVQSVDAGESAVAPAVAASKGWIFTGWDRAFDVITGETVINAVYSVDLARVIDFDDLATGTTISQTYGSEPGVVEVRLGRASSTSLAITADASRVASGYGDLSRAAGVFTSNSSFVVHISAPGSKIILESFDIARSGATTRTVRWRTHDAQGTNPSLYTYAEGPATGRNRVTVNAESNDGIYLQIVDGSSSGLWYHAIDNIRYRIEDVGGVVTHRQAFDRLFTDAGITGLAAQAGGDANANGIPNLVEYAMGGNPVTPGTTTHIFPGMDVTGGYFEVEFQRLKDLTGLSLTWETSDNLVPPWENASAISTVVTNPDVHGDGKVERVRVRFSASSSSAFYRLGAAFED